MLHRVAQVFEQLQRLVAAARRLGGVVHLGQPLNIVRRPRAASAEPVDQFHAARRSDAAGRTLAAAFHRAEGKGEAEPVVECTDTNKDTLIKCLAPNRRVEIDEVKMVREIKK